MSGQVFFSVSISMLSLVVLSRTYRIVKLRAARLVKFANDARRGERRRHFGSR